MDNIYTILVTAVTVLGGSQAFRYYERRAMHRERDEDFIRHDCKERIAKLEALLENEKLEKEELNNTVLQLTKEVSELRVMVEFLTKNVNKP